MPVKKPTTRHGHDFAPKPVPARVSGDPWVARAREHHRVDAIDSGGGGRAKGVPAPRVKVEHAYTAA